MESPYDRPKSRIGTMNAGVAPVRSPIPARSSRGEGEDRVALRLLGSSLSPPHEVPQEERARERRPFEHRFMERDQTNIAQYQFHQVDQNKNQMQVSPT